MNAAWAYHLKAKMNGMNESLGVTKLSQNARMVYVWTRASSSCVFRKAHSSITKQTIEANRTPFKQATFIQQKFNVIRHSGSTHDCNLKSISSLAFDTHSQLVQTIFSIENKNDKNFIAFELFMTIDNMFTISLCVRWDVWIVKLLSWWKSLVRVFFRFPETNVIK